MKGILLGGGLTEAFDRVECEVLKANLMRERDMNEKEIIDAQQKYIEQLEEVLTELMNEAHTATKGLHSHSLWSMRARKLLEDNS